jgi:hypothetical protein
MISAYTIALGVEQRRYPWRAAIESALTIADEFCLVYDERFDDHVTLREVDERVHLIPVTIDFLEWDFINNLLTKARRACRGEWCLLTEMDMVFNDIAHERIPRAIDRAERAGHEAVNLRSFSSVYDLVDMDKFHQGPSRQSLTRNIPEIYHKTSDYMIDFIESDIWGGKCIRSYEFDDFSYCDERTGRWFCDRDALYVDSGYSKDVSNALENFAHIFHYAAYNMGRKNAQGRQTSIWQNRTYGRSKEMDVEKQIELLKQRIVINPGDTQEAYRYFQSRGWVATEIKHPSWVQSWVGGMGLEAT